MCGLNEVKGMVVFMSKYDVSIYKNELNRLIHVTKCICNLYSDRTLKNKEEVNKEIEFMIQIENELYEKLDITTQKKGDKLLEYFYNLLNHSSYSEEIKDSIESRVYNYCYYLVNHLPFASTKQNFAKRELDDLSKINMQEYSDYFRNMLFYLSNYLQNSKNKQEQKIIYETINAILYQQKFLEKIDYSKIKINGREKCIILNINNTLVDSDYEEFCANTIKNCMNECLKYSNENFKNIRNKTRFNITLLSMKVGLSLLEKDELANMINYYKNEVILKMSQNESLKCVDAMTEIIEEVVHDKTDEKVKQKA